MGARAFQGLVGHAGWACRATFADSRLIKELNHQQHRSGYGPHARRVTLRFFPSNASLPRLPIRLLPARTNQFPGEVAPAEIQRLSWAHCW